MSIDKTDFHTSATKVEVIRVDTHSNANPEQ